MAGGVLPATMSTEAESLRPAESVMVSVAVYTPGTVKGTRGFATANVRAAPPFFGATRHEYFSGSPSGSALAADVNSAVNGSAPPLTEVATAALGRRLPAVYSIRTSELFGLFANQVLP